MDSQQHTAQVGSLAFPSPLPWGLCVALAGLEIPTQTKLTSNSDICLFLPPVGLSTFQPTSCVTLGLVSVPIFPLQICAKIRSIS